MTHRSSCPRWSWGPGTGWEGGSLGLWLTVEQICPAHYWLHFAWMRKKLLLREPLLCWAPRAGYTVVSRSRLIKRWEGFGKQEGVHWNKVCYLLSARPCTGRLTCIITTNFHKLGGMYYYHMHFTDEEKRLSEFLVQVTELKSVKLDWILSYSGSGLFSLAFLLCCSQEWNGLLENVLCRAEFCLLNYLSTHS